MLIMLFVFMAGIVTLENHVAEPLREQQTEEVRHGD